MNNCYFQKRLLRKSRRKKKGKSSINKEDKSAESKDSFNLSNRTRKLHRAKDHLSTVLDNEESSLSTPRPMSALSAMSFDEDDKFSQSPPDILRRSGKCCLWQ